MIIGCMGFACGKECRVLVPHGDPTMLRRREEKELKKEEKRGGRTLRRRRVNHRVHFLMQIHPFLENSLP